MVRRFLFFVVSLLMGLMVVQCGEINSTGYGLGAGSGMGAGGESASVNLVMTSPYGTDDTDGSVSKALGDDEGLVSKAIITPNSCAISVVSSDFSQISKSFSYQSTVTVDIDVPIGASRTFSVNCTDSSLTEGNITVGFEGASTADITSTTSTVTLNPRFRNLLNDNDQNLILSSIRFNEFSGNTQARVVLDFEKTLTPMEQVASRCTVEFNLDASDSTRKAIDVTQSACLTSATPGNPTLHITGGSRFPQCNFFDSTGNRFLRAAGSWDVDSDGRTRLICNFGVKQLTDFFDLDEKGYIAGACRLSTAGNCDAVPNSGFGVYDLSTSVNADTSTPAEPFGTCSFGNSGRDCSTGWCVTSSTSDGDVCLGLSAVTNAGSVTTTAGTTSSGSTSGAFNDARFNTPNGLIVSPDGDYIFIADTANHLIRRINLTLSTNSSSYVTRFIGRTGSTGSIDGSCADAVGGTSFSSPRYLAMNGIGTNLYVADTGNNSIRRVAVSSGSCSGTNTTLAIGLGGPRGIVLDSNSTYLYIAETTSHRISRMPIATSTPSIFAGTGSAGAADGTGNDASFSSPIGLAIDSIDSFLYVTDTGNNAVRRINLQTYVVNTLTLSGVAIGTVRGSLAIDPTDTYLYLTTLLGNERLQRIELSTGELTTTVDGGGLVNILGLAINNTGGTIYAANSNHRILASQ